MTGHQRPGGTRGVYISCECSTRKRTKQCSMKSIAKHVVEGLVISHLEAHLFSRAGIDALTKKISPMQRSRARKRRERFEN